MKKIFFLLSLMTSPMLLASDSEKQELEELYQTKLRIDQACEVFDIKEHIATRSDGVYKSNSCDIVLDVDSCSSDNIIAMKMTFEWMFVQWNALPNSVKDIKNDKESQWIRQLGILASSIIKHVKVSQAKFSEDFDIEQCKSCLIDFKKNNEIYLQYYYGSVAKNSDIETFLKNNTMTLTDMQEYQKADTILYKKADTILYNSAKNKDSHFLLYALSLKHTDVLLNYLKIKLVEQNIVSPEGLSKYLIDLNIL